uniref:SMC domain protein n=1 Tax=Cyanothece sp. (strain PCC 7425 / ATCC 29141) TaxID=395961 RepID=B8HSX3_CYAP4
MRVKSLKMQNFRGFENLTLDFSETEPTVFFGINGVGKSSILDCLAILLSRILTEVQTFRSLKSSRPLILKESDISSEKDECANEALIFLKTSSEFIVKSSIFKAKHTYAHAEQQIDEAIIFQKYIYDELKSSPDANIPFAVYYSINRHLSEVILEDGGEQYSNQFAAYDQAILDGGIYFEDFFYWFKSTEDYENEVRLNTDIRYQNHQLQSVRNAIYQLIPTFSNLRVRRSPPLRMTVNKKLGDQEQELTINQLSDGEKCLLAMVGDIARRLAIANPGLENPLEGEGVVLIDEIELHLHPAWQRQIIPALTRTFPNCQFICTTHSPQVLSELKPESIYCLERTEEGQVIAYHPHNPYGKDSNYILEVLMGVTERPKRIKEQLLELFRLIETGQLEEAKRLQRRLEAEIGEDEPEFAKADVLIRRREAIGR